MEAPYKLLYLFIICDCDVAGIWNPDFEIASIYLGIKVDRKKFMQLYENKYIELENGQFFIPGFIRHQYSAGLCTTNPAHKKIIEKLTALNLIDSTLNPEGAWKGLVSRSQATKVKEKVKEEEEIKVKEMEKEKWGGLKSKIPHLFRESDIFDKAVFTLKLEQDERYASAHMDYYHEVILNWSDEGNRKKNWLSTVKNWMLRDLQKGQFVDKNFNPNKFKNGSKNQQAEQHGLDQLERIRTGKL